MGDPGGVLQLSDSSQDPRGICRWESFAAPPYQKGLFPFQNGATYGFVQLSPTAGSPYWGDGPMPTPTDVTEAEA